MKQKLFKLVAIEALFAFVLFFVSDMPLAFSIPLMAFLLFFGVIVLEEIASFEKLQKEWQKNPIPVCTEEFEEFFFNLKISHQEWYFKNILSDDDIIKLKEWYPKIKLELSFDQKLSKRERVFRRLKYSKHAQLLENLIYFYRTKCSNAD